MGSPLEMSQGMGWDSMHCISHGTYGTEIDEQEIENLLNKHTDLEYECQNDNELRLLLNFKVNKVNKFYRFGSLFVRVVLSSTHYTEIFTNLLNFIELYFDGNRLGWDGLGQA